jgi:uncharacterized protein YbaP (TraB family)
VIGRYWLRAAALSAAAFGLLALPACRAPDPSAAPPRMEARPSAGPAIWRLADADSTIYLFGTVHLLPDNLAWRSRAFDAAFAKAELLYLETPTGPAASQDVGRAVAERGLDLAGPTLEAKLPPVDAQRLSRVLKKLQIAPASMARMRPWLASLQIAVADLSRRGYDPAFGVETILEAEADKRGLARRYFETADQQIGFLSSLSEAEQVGMLSATLRQLESGENADGEMDRLWAQGDVAGLARLLEEQMGEAGPAVYDVLLTRRNAAWANQIAVLMEGRGVVFVAVGAAHLAGPKSVQAMLRAKGFKVEGP